MSRILIGLSGKDKPGITHSVLTVLAESHAQIIDIEQAVIHDQLSLTFMAEVNTQTSVANMFDSLLIPLHKAADKFGLTIRVVPFRQSAIRRSSRRTYAITVLGETIAAADLATVTGEIRRLGLNIEKIHTLTEVGFDSLELVVYPSKGDVPEARIKQALLSSVRNLNIDIAVQRETFNRRNKRLLVLDVDSTLVQGEIIDEIAAEANVQAEVAAITERAMAGELDFREALTARVALLKGVPESVLTNVAERMVLTPGAEELITAVQHLGYKVAIISGGFQFFTNRLKERLGLDYAFANRLDIVDGYLSGELYGPIVDREEKARIVQELATEMRIGRDQVVAVGDGANDLNMLEVAGLGIGFHPKPVLRDRVDVSVSAGGLNRILYLLGMDDISLRTLAAGEGGGLETPDTP